MGLRLADRIGAALAARGASGASGAPALSDDRRNVPLAALAASSLIQDADALDGRSVLIRTRAPLAAAAALASLDGVAARLVLCPPDLDPGQLAEAAVAAQVDAIVCDMEQDGGPLTSLLRRDITLDHGVAAGLTRSPSRETEWALFTSGTSGAAKLVGHSLDALTGAIAPRPPTPGEPLPIWATFYDVRRYGGLQMLLRALTGGFDLLLTDPSEPMEDFLARVGARSATHVAGTPSHWRRALMSPALEHLAPRYVRLSGEIADQAVLDALTARFPHAKVAHAYASTEAGVGFEVGDGLEGFPAALVERRDGPVGLRIVDGALQLRSARAAKGYLGAEAATIADPDGWVDTGDLVERRGERFHFLGRRSGVINVGGLKISPEEVEAVINACPEVRMSRVSGRPSPLLGALVSAEVVLSAPLDAATARSAILARCRAALPPHKTPASIRFVEALAVGAAGKLERRNA